ncbi:unnamed protein product [Triticum aestivum]|uniref:Uncharacterized protein n=1 Tax=Triticum aestivum TaxID=4565 RepID=A0A7H4LAB1_WHEAT|nr:unnamed protein product [Triticum aestivum]
MVLPKEMGSLVGCLVLPTATSPSSMEPFQPLDFVDSGGLDAAIALSPEVVGQVASVGAEDDEVGPLAPNPEALKPIRSPIFDRDAMLARIDEVVFVKKLGHLLTFLDAACPGSGKVVACLLVEEGSTGKVKKVKKALRAIGKKSGTTGKASAAA